MVVRVVGNHEVLSLVEEVISSEGDSTLVVEEELCNLCVPYELRLLS